MFLLSLVQLKTASSKFHQISLEAMQFPPFFTSFCCQSSRTDRVMKSTLEFFILLPMVPTKVAQWKFEKIPGITKVELYSTWP